MDTKTKHDALQPDEQQKRFIKWLTGNMAACQKNIDDFADAVRVNPLNALESSKKIFEAAALHKAYQCLKFTVDDLGFVEGANAFLRDMHKQAVDRAMYPVSSCSVSYNFASQCFTAALLTVCRDLQQRWLEKR